MTAIIWKSYDHQHWNVMLLPWMINSIIKGIPWPSKYTHSLAHSLARLLAHPPARSPARSLARPPARSLMHARTHERTRDRAIKRAINRLINRLIHRVNNFLQHCNTELQECRLSKKMVELRNYAVKYGCKFSQRIHMKCCMAYRECRFYCVTADFYMDG